MNASGLPEPVKNFILKYLHSVEQLEVLLLLRKFPETEWTAEKVSQDIRTNTASVASRLEGLHALKIISKRQDAGQAYYRYAPPSACKNVIDDLARFYATHSARIIELMYSRPMGAIRWFADSFRIRKDDE